MKDVFSVHWSLIECCQSKRSLITISVRIVYSKHPSTKTAEPSAGVCRSPAPGDVLHQVTFVELMEPLELSLRENLTVCLPSAAQRKQDATNVISQWIISELMGTSRFRLSRINGATLVYDNADKLETLAQRPASPSRGAGLLHQTRNIKAADVQSVLDQHATLHWREPAWF